MVPYRGAGESTQALVSEQIDVLLNVPGISMGQIKAGAMKAYAVTAPTRATMAPDIPTTDEAGLPGFYFSFWHAIWVPKGTPKDIIAKLNATISQILADPKVKQRFAELGIQITPIDQQSPEALRVLQKAEAERWWPIMKASNIKPE